MMARSLKGSVNRPDTDAQDQLLQIISFGLQRAAGPYRWAMKRHESSRQRMRPMRSTSSNRSHQSIMSGVYLSSREKYLACASRQYCSERSPSPSSQAKASSTSSNRRFVNSIVGFRNTLPVKNYHLLADLGREKSLTLCPTSRALCSRENKLKQPVRQVGTIAKRKCL